MKAFLTLARPPVGTPAYAVFLADLDERKLKVETFDTEVVITYYKPPTQWFAKTRLHDSFTRSFP